MAATPTSPGSPIEQSRDHPAAAQEGRVASDHDDSGGDAGIPSRSVRGDDGRHDPPARDHRGVARVDGDSMEPLGGLPPVRGPHGEYQGTLTEATFGYAEMTDGAVPPPLMLRGYGDVDPTFPGRIFAMAEKEQDAQIETVRRASRAEALAVTLGAIITPIFIVGLLLLTGVLLLNGQQAAGIASLVGSLSLMIAPALTAAVTRRSPAVARPTPKRAKGEAAPPK